MLGLVRASGYMESIKEDVIGSGDAMEAVCQVWRKGEDNPVTHRFSVADAKRANLWGKAGPWQQYPRRMLQMRARGFCLRDMFPDVLKGLYSREELEGVQERYMGSAVVEDNATIDDALLAEAKRRQEQAVDTSAQETISIRNDTAPAPAAEKPQEPAKNDDDWPRPNEDGELVDVRGCPWIEAVHSANKTCTDAGTWRRRRGVDPGEVKRRETVALLPAREKLQAFAEMEAQSDIAPDSSAHVDERERVTVETSEAPTNGFSFETLIDEIATCQTEEDAENAEDLIRTSGLSDAQNEHLLNALANKRSALMTEELPLG